MSKNKEQKKKLPRGYYNLEKLGISNEKADFLLASQWLARLDRFIDSVELIQDMLSRIVYIDQQRLEMQLRESMSRIVSRTEQQELYKRVLADPNVRKVALSEDKWKFKPFVKTKGKKLK